MVRIKTILNFLTYMVALLGFMPLFPYLEPLSRFVMVAAIAAGIMIDWKERSVNPRIPTVVSLLFFIFYVARFTREDLVGPAVNLLAVLLAIRLCSEKSPRNYLQIYALSLFSLAGSSLFNLSPLFLIYFLLMLTLIAVSLVVLTFSSSSSSKAISRAGMKKIVSTALVMPVASLPLLLFFFFILPRTQYPLWDFLNSGKGKVAGFGEKVDPGGASAVGETRKVAYRVSCAKLPKNLLYWRGIVLNSFEGKGWIRREPPGTEQEIAGKGQLVRQTVFPEPGYSTYLLALNIPRTISGIRFSQSFDCIYTRRGTSAGHEKYEAISALAGTINARGVDRNFYLALPPLLSRRMLSLGRGIAGRGKDDAARVALLEDFYSASRLNYANLDLPVGEQPLDQFLFEKRKGNCEFFASSFAILLRVAGVPARLVGGYYGGDYNELGGYYAVTEDMAHVWVEAYIAGKGWITIDPSKWAVNFSGRKEIAKGFIRRLSMTLDVLGFYWNLAVINYDLDRQLKVISGVNSRLKHVRAPGNLKQLLLVAMVPVMGLGVASLARRRRITVEERILRKFLRQVRLKLKVEVSPATGLHELAALVNDPSADRFIALYEGAVYRDRRLTPTELKELKGIVTSLRDPHRNRTGAKRPSPSS